MVTQLHLLAAPATVPTPGAGGLHGRGMRFTATEIEYLVGPALSTCSSTGAAFRSSAQISSLSTGPVRGAVTGCSALAGHTTDRLDLKPQVKTSW
jgi:hypothetical protein